MPAIGKITLDSRDYEATLDKIRVLTEKKSAQAAKAAGNASDVAKNKTAEAVGKVGSKISAAGGALSAFGASAGQHFGAIGQALSALTAGPVAALVGAFGAILAVGTQIWDRLSLSAEEYVAKLSSVAQRADKAKEKLLAQQADDSGYMDRLIELSKQERLSNAAKTEAATLIKILSSRYKDLGISIDAMTGKIIGADKAQRKMFEEQRRQRLTAVGRQIESHDRKSQKQAEMAVNSMFIGENMLQTFGLSFKSAQEARAAVSDVMENRPLEDRIKLAEKLRDASKTQSDMENWQKVVDSLEKQLELYSEYELLLKSGHSSEKEQADALKKNSDAEKAKNDFLAREQVNDQDVPKASSGVSAKEQADALKLINELKTKGIELTEAEAAAVLRKRQALESAKYYKEQISILQDHIAAQNQLASGMDEQAQRQRLINELKKRGLEHDEKSIQKILELNAALGSAKLKNSQVKEIESLYDRALRSVGRTKEADERKALAKAEETKGAPLSDEEKAATLKLLELTSSLEKMSNQKVAGDFAIHTNALTARGGFQTGARVPDLSQYERQIAQNTQKHSEIVTRIEALLREVMQ